MKKVIFLFIAGSLLTLNSCTKTGPQGPRGYDGNANVIGSDPFTVPGSTWTHNVGDNNYEATFTDNDLSSDVVSNGLVEIYKQYPSGSWTNLPDINGNISTVYNFYQGGFDIYVINTDGTTTQSPGTFTFRTVIIPSSLRLAHPNTNWKNYNEAMAAIAETAATTHVAQ